MQAQGGPPNRVFGVIFSAFVMVLAQRLKGVVVSSSKTAADELSPPGSMAQRSVALRMARTTRLVATGLLRTNSRLPVST